MRIWVVKKYSCCHGTLFFLKSYVTLLSWARLDVFYRLPLYYLQLFQTFTLKNSKKTLPTLNNNSKEVEVEVEQSFRYVRHIQYYS